MTESEIETIARAAASAVRIALRAHLAPKPPRVRPGRAPALPHPETVAGIRAAYARWLDDPRPGIGFTHDNGETVGVSTSELRRCWVSDGSTFGGPRWAPSLQRLGKVLRRLSGAEPTRAGDASARGPRVYWVRRSDLAP